MKGGDLDIDDAERKVDIGDRKYVPQETFFSRTSDGDRSTGDTNCGGQLGRTTGGHWTSTSEYRLRCPGGCLSKSHQKPDCIVEGPVTSDEG